MSHPNIDQITAMDGRLYGLAADSSVYAYDPVSGKWEPYRHDIKPASLPKKFGSETFEGP